MKRSFKFNTILFSTILITSSVLQSCGGSEASKQATTEAANKEKTEVVYNTDSPESMIAAIIKACGGNDKLRALKDVSYMYYYVKPDGKKDISEEKYIFDDEVSWARYTTHQENVSPDLEGEVVQYFDGKSAHAYHNGQALEDSKDIGSSSFLRQANYMWFMMMFKLNDPGTVLNYKGSEYRDAIKYDMLEVTYDPSVTGKEQNDIYTLYINPENHLVEQFKFSLPALGIEKPVLLAKLTYDEIDGIQVMTRRQMFSPAPEGNGMVPMVDQVLKNIKFNNGFTAEGLSKEV